MAHAAKPTDIKAGNPSDHPKGDHEKTAHADSTQPSEVSSNTEGESQSQVLVPKKKKSLVKSKKRDSDDDFEPLDPEMAAYVGGYEGTNTAGGGWADLLQEKAKEEEEEEYEDDEEWDEEEEGEESPEEEEILESPQSPFTWHPSEEGFKESDLASRKKRRFLIGTHSFLELADPNLEKALEPFKPEDEKLSKSEKIRRSIKAEKENYKEKCKKAGITPNSNFLAAIGSSVLDLRGHGLSDKEIAAICSTLETDIFIKTCLLSGNAAGLVGAVAIAGMIENNYKIQYLDLSNSEILEGFFEICEATALNEGILTLDLSKNELGDEQMMFAGNLLADTDSLLHLSLASNDIKDLGLNYLGVGLAENTYLKSLDLSGNRIRGEKKAAPFFTACAEHPQLKRLNFRRNVIRNNGAKQIGRVLSKNLGMQELDLSCNMMEESSGGPIGRSLNNGPREITKLFLEQQWWHQQAASSVLKPFANANNFNPEQPMEIIDFGFTLDIHKSFIKVRDKAKLVNPDLQIIHGEPYGMEKSKNPDAKALVIRRANVVCENFETPLVMLMEELAKEPKKIKSQDFKKFIKQCNLYKDKALTEAFEKVFASGFSEVNGEAILEAFDKEYPGLRKIPDPEPEAEPAPVVAKKDKKKKGKGEKSKKGKGKSPGVAKAKSKKKK